MEMCNLSTHLTHDWTPSPVWLSWCEASVFLCPPSYSVKDSLNTTFIKTTGWSSLVHSWFYLQSVSSAHLHLPTVASVPLKKNMTNQLSGNCEGPVASLNTCDHIKPMGGSLYVHVTIPSAFIWDAASLFDTDTSSVSASENTSHTSTHDMWSHDMTISYMTMSQIPWPEPYTYHLTCDVFPQFFDLFIGGVQSQSHSPQRRSIIWKTQTQDQARKDQVKYICWCVSESWYNSNGSMTCIYLNRGKTIYWSSKCQSYCPRGNWTPPRSC